MKKIILILFSIIITSCGSNTKGAERDLDFLFDEAVKSKKIEVKRVEGVESYITNCCMHEHDANSLLERNGFKITKKTRVDDKEFFDMYENNLNLKNYDAYMVTVKYRKEFSINVKYEIYLKINNEKIENVLAYTRDLYPPL